MTQRRSGAKLVAILTAGGGLLVALTCTAAMAATAGLSDREGRPFPLTEMKATVPGREPLLALIVTGDGGWAPFDKAVARQLTEHGVAVVGLSSPAYFKHARDPDGLAADASHILRHYLDTWQRIGIVLIGYSTGADAIPFVVNRLPPSLRSQVRLVVLVGPYGTANFRSRWVDWLDAPPPPGAHETLPEILSSAQYGVPTLCIHGVEEKGSLCPQLAGTFVRVVTLPGGHHFQMHFTRVGHVILQSLDSGAGTAGAGTATETSTQSSP